MAPINQLGPGTWQISLPFQGTHGIIGTYLLSRRNEVVLIDPGPSTTAEALLTTLRDANFDPHEVTHILLTHIHLDHAGGTGTLLRSMPNAIVHVHSQGAVHMVDPSKIIASAHRIYGTRMQELWGNVEPVPRDRVQILDGGDIINIAGRRLEVHYTPGHAIHHVVFFDAHSGDLFTGDVAGVRLQSINYVRPPTPPPDLDIEVWSDSIDKLKRLRPDVLYLAHFGPSKNAMEHLEHLRAILFDWGEFILKAMRENKSESEIVEMLAAQTDPDILHTTGDPAAVKRYEIASNYAMSVQGYTRYWQKKHPERLQ